ncbi:F-box domain containing protein [Metarhizium album ARSEF 1941]|uniref:F-box domain containing protein n=1 Tax=Metarhizium album (strain ARSEF 1941) TaxID=1081103 RepID=A0A0B2X3K4_METAS|nr:F-box domain containing protein [Metarhizium album ARSEF 1941]KHO00929.1 F-box domain containing protein [Metarhizium album ARSEF 1941]
MAQLPVEIIEIITSHLTRAEVRNLRLVCRAFEAKVSPQYFRNVVVPFRSELYGALVRDEHGSMRHSTSSLFSNGMYMFKSFGPHILRFALSLELDEDSLAYPPVKPLQEAVPAFWGIYRWPPANYRRYTDLEGLEQTADETEGMRAALACLTKVQNIGLCCDAGLGFLLGPDKAARNAHIHHPVFATVDWRRHQRSAQSVHQPAITVADFNDLARDQHKSMFPNLGAFRNATLERDAGYCGPQVQEAVRIMLETGNNSLDNINFDERSASPAPNLDPAGAPGHADLFDSPRDEADSPLIPVNLTRAQKEMLLELEWAHRAMIQSYVLGLIDNAYDGCFQHVTTFTIAKIPTSHVHLFCRDDFWGSIPSLRNVSIGVIADWRRVNVSTPEFVEDTRISPVESVGKVFTLLSDHVAKCRNIESLHFEWICGGEFAPSSYQRNSYILPAPIVNQPDVMISPRAVRRDRSSLLRLPHVKHLSLKNCWSSPHVFLQAVRQFALLSLEKLELESVSLSGPPTTVPEAMAAHLPVPLPAPALALAGVAPAAAFAVSALQDNDQDLADLQDALPPGLLLTLPPLYPLPPQPQHFNVPGNPPSHDVHDAPIDWLRQPDLLTWTGFIDHFSPSVKIRQLLAEKADHHTVSTALVEKIVAASEYIPDFALLRGHERRYRLKCLAFKSCGYVSVDTPYLKTREIISDLHHGRTVFHGSNHRIMTWMQSSKDKLLAEITQCMKEQEEAMLVHAFGMTMGWKDVYSAWCINDAKRDGVQRPGSGRFSGLLEACDRGLRHQQAPSPSPAAT